MAIMRMNDIRKMSEEELNKNLNELRLELSKERANIHIGASVTSPGRLKEVKRSIARILSFKEESKRGK